MSSQHEGEKAEETVNPQDFPGMVVEQYRKIKEHAETYPFVWGSYILVYGGLGLWTAYRWRKLRKTEDRVRALQERLRKVVESQESAASTTQKVPPSFDKTQSLK
ncbi:uncharacterized protein LOC130014485 [Mercurialis annua]|uniref:uncharacterized protein LOC130014485 n=1 Tax=Mercurialis annua TaxID=3986 RepID=UPI00215FC53D|nr:uncharacterized protein LOC130014485 [Mercurialis annua]